MTEETTLEAQKKIKDLQRKHEWDPNLPSDTLEELDDAAHEHDLSHDLNLVSEFEDHSPYPEVRAAVRNVGDTLFSLNDRLLTDNLSMMKRLRQIQFEPGP